MTAPKIFRITVEVGDLDTAAGLYAENCSAVPGQAAPRRTPLLRLRRGHPGGARPDRGWHTAEARAPSRSTFGVADIDDVHARAKALGMLAPFQVHGQPAGDVIERPWGERSFYATYLWGNELSFVADGTLYT